MLRMNTAALRPHVRPSTCTFQAIVQNNSTLLPARQALHIASECTTCPLETDYLPQHRYSPLRSADNRKDLDIIHLANLRFLQNCQHIPHHVPPCLSRFQCSPMRLRDC